MTIEDVNMLEGYPFLSSSLHTAQGKMAKASGKSSVPSIVEKRDRQP